MIAIIDYGMGNLQSVHKALETLGAKAIVTRDPHVIKNAVQVVLPGVGAMGPAMEQLRQRGFIEPVMSAIKEGKPFLGICLGLQLLFESSEEGGNITGLGIIPGSVKKFDRLKVPHMGWNQLNLEQSSAQLWEGIENGANVYFCHSYYVVPRDKSIIASTTEYGIDFVSAVHKDNLWGLQFHPEKSQETGLRILKNFVTLQR